MYIIWLYSEGDTISGLILNNFLKLDVPMTQMGGRISRPVTDEKKKKYSHVFPCLLYREDGAEAQVRHRVAEETAACTRCCIKHFRLEN